MTAKLYISNLPLETKEEELFTYLSKVGRVFEVKIIRSMDGKTSTGRAYVIMASPALASHAVNKLDNKVFNKLRLRVMLVHNIDSENWHMPLPFRQRKHR